MSGFGPEKRHRVTFEVRGPKTTAEVKRYMGRIKAILRGLPGNIKLQTKPTARRTRKAARRKPRRRRSS
jgi:hypothetical protein